MKLNNIEDFSKNNWYSITTGSTTGQSTESQPQTQPSDQSSSSAIVTKLKQQQQVPDSKQVDSAGITKNSQQIELVNIEEDLVDEEEQNIYINPSVNYPIIMPSKEVLIAQQESLKMSQQPATISQQQLNSGSHYPSDVLAVEELVHEIKENLRLKSRPHGRTSRPSPYHIPCRSWNDHTQQQNISSLSTSSICSNNSSNLSSYNSQENHLNNCCTTTTTTTASISNYKNSNYHSHHHHQSHYHQRYKKEQDIDDPYELLQALLKSKNLVKEAVRRLQLNTISPKQKKQSYFYDSDDDSRSPMFRVCQLEL